VVLVTGGAGFIGSALVRLLRRVEPLGVVNLDKLTYAGHRANIDALAGDSGHVFVHGDIGDLALVRRLFQEHRPRAVMHLAAETHVDRSILGARPFLETNVLGTHALLAAAREYHADCGPDRDRFRFLLVSTDEVYGSLGPDAPAFTETTPYDPRSPYAASKAAADHLAAAWFHTYGLPVLITNCSNNYGPRQYPEKLIPLMILLALEGLPLPVYGDGLNVRDWLYVDDHARALRLVLDKGRPGQTYNIGGAAEIANIDLIRTLCRRLDDLMPESPHRPHERLIRFVPDRPGHDRRYAMNFDKIKNELGWIPKESFESGLYRTIDWYLEHPEWIQAVAGPEFRQWLKRQYGTAA
jgi:dTDP-glucose 4,6-dehydratase